jgi:type 1 fimbria pilin
LSDIDKHIYVETLKRYYDLAVDELHRRRFFNFDIDLIDFIRLNNMKESISYQMSSQQQATQQQPSSSNTIYSSSTSYKEKLMPDGSKIVLNESVSNNNGDVTKNTNSYRRLANGSTEPLEYNEALKKIENKLYLV